MDRWRFLVGTQEELEPVWKAYWLDPSVDTSVGYQIVHLHEDGELHVHEVDRREWRQHRRSEGCAGRSADLTLSPGVSDR